MPDDDRYVLLCRCRDVVETQSVRASLDARGIPVRVEGEYVHGILGSFHGAMVQPRVMVPASALRLARRIAADVVGPFDDTDDDEEAEAVGSPWRLPAGDDEIATDDASAAELEEGPLVRPKRLGVLALLALMGIAVGFAHIYVGHPRRGVALLVVTAFAIGSTIVDGPGLLLIPIVWVLDLVGGVVGVVRHNRRLARAPGPASVAEHSGDVRPSR